MNSFVMGFMIFLVIILGAVGICFLALTNFTLFKIIFPILFLFALTLVAWKEFITWKQYRRFVQDLVKIFNGKVIINNFSKKQVFFEYANKKFEYFHFSSWTRISSTTHFVRKDLLRTEADSNLSLLFWHKTGDSIIGKTTDRMIAFARDGACRKIDTSDVSLFKDYVVFTNDEFKTKSLFSDTDVLRLFSEYKNSRSSYALEPPPLSIRKGIITLEIYLNVICDTELFKRNLSNMNLLVDRINVL